ncbi:branched-chain amino acid ABC transporter permease [Segnochrobactrum spirostomi]|uniref:Branched-chain amino acid ABC transporter permease n=1 Tax=Segnochrobactrum spirostomi TaxID=2608987 RepID=A0A6A7YD88_9HYPH|nr:branched-chain amino acid ABC transporter permease [Segnochrobactrum spirostomi]MQT15379.1 branched-chain amino acid ABC transporter permease [Segnochrobactrum spirostomi]
MSDPFIVISTLLSGVLLGGMLALTALGLSIVLGVMRLVNLAHGELLVVGAYAGLFLLMWTGIDPLLLLPLIGLGVGAGGYVVYIALLRPIAQRGPEAPMMTTFGLSIIAQNLFVAFLSADTRSIDRPYASVPLELGAISVPQVYIIGFAIAVVVILAVHFMIAHTSFGRDLRASTDDPRAAAIIGVNVARVHALTFALGAAAAGIGGTLMGIAFSFTPTTGATYLLTDFAIIVLGGLGSVAGTLVGGIAIGLIQSLGGLVFGDGYRDLAGFLMFLVVLALRPRGFLRERG